LDISIGHPASASLCDSLENVEGFLATGLILFGDNAHVNTACMATPFKAVKSSDKDDYNFYHSQVSHLLSRVAFSFSIDV